MTGYLGYSLCLLALMLVLQVDAECKVSDCTSDYEDALEEQRIARTPSVAFCQAVLDFSTCLKSTARACRGNIMFLSSNTAVRRLFDNYNCSSIVGLGKLVPETPRPRPSIIPELPPNEIAPPPPSTQRHCIFHGRDKYKYCGLFGDPHLKTFKSRYQTCRVHGAWPLIDNPYLGITVTNGPVFEGSDATVTTLVTVLIKGRATKCTTEKTYEATSDQPLPDTFVDGTRNNGSVFLSLQDIDDNHQTVEIFLKYIKTTIVIRQVGKYLAIAVQMPEELVELEADGDFHLCMSGCPLSEELKSVAPHRTALSWEAALALCRDTTDLAREINNNLTDHYLDWCVFDVMTTGADEAEAFVTAAHSAQADALRFEPQNLLNNTEPKYRPRPFANTGNVPLSPVFAWLIVTASLTWTLFLNRLS